MPTKLAAQVTTEDTPKKTSKLHTTTPKSFPHGDLHHYCKGCQESRTSSDSDTSTVLANISDFNFNDFTTRVFAHFNELNTKIELISNQIPHINESISDHHAIINKLERQISLIAKKLSSLYNKSSVPASSSAELSLNYIPSDLCYPQFLRPNLYEIQSDIYYSHLYYPRFLGPKFSTLKYRG